MTTRYLEGVPRRTFRSAGRVLRLLLLWVLAMVLFVAIWQLLSPPPSPSPSPRAAGAARSQTAPRAEVQEESAHARADVFDLAVPLAVLVAVGVGAWLLVVRRAQRGLSETNDVEQLFLCERYDDAIARAQRQLRTGRLQPYPAFRAFLMLGKCVEAKGEFADAAEVYGAAAGAVPSAPGVLGTMRQQLAPLASAQKAFALAADGRLDEADVELRAAAGPVAMPGTRAMAVRARAVVLAKRAQYKELLDLLASERAVVKRSLAYKDRMLLRALAAHARQGVASAVDGRARSGGVAPLHVDGDTRAWITRVFPPARALWEAA